MHTCAGCSARCSARTAGSWLQAVGDPTPTAIQHLLGRAVWDADAVRDDLREYVVEHLGRRDAVLVVDETGFLKKGEHSLGVQRQYTGTAGRIENSQVGVFLAYATDEDRAFIDRELYLPDSWMCDRTRCDKVGVPAEQDFATKPELARRMIERALEADVPFLWVTGDEVYGNDRNLRIWLEENERPYVMAISSNQYLRRENARSQHAATIAKEIQPSQWQRLCSRRRHQGAAPVRLGMDAHAELVAAHAARHAGQTQRERRDRCGVLRCLCAVPHATGGVGPGGRSALGH
jgi:SRSO17 transposase